jgi:hypothetical protein
MNEKNQTPGIHPKAEDSLYDFPDEERRIVHREHPTFYLLRGDKSYVLVWRLRNLAKVAAE